MSSATMQSVSAQEVKKLLRDSDELALIDVREQGVYFHEHLLFASCIALGDLETRVGDLIPRRTTPIVVCDGEDDGPARTAATRLVEFGYSNVSVMHGGVAAWRESGFEVFSGINVVSKAFGEYIEHRYGTPHITAQELAAKQSANENMVILDSRPLEEFRNISIPGGIDCPGAELVHRVFDAAPDPETLVVVNCAGRTRSIIGAQSLINATIPNRVVALKDGTMGWQLAGYEPASNETAFASQPSDSGRERARSAANRVARKFEVPTIDKNQLELFERECEQRTTYILDVRTPQEYAAGHVVGSRPAPGGQLVQATDEFVATRNARIVLVDDDGTRATMTASWLKQMGWRDVYVLEPGSGTAMQTGAYEHQLLGCRASASLSARDLKLKMDVAEPVLILDFASSLAYRKQHIPGARWAMRTRLPAALSGIENKTQIVLTSSDGTLAEYVEHDFRRNYPDQHVSTLKGGTLSWVDDGFPVADGPEFLTTEANDVWYKPYEQASSVRDAMQGYLDWEVNLVAQIERDGDARFS